MLFPSLLLLALLPAHAEPDPGDPCPTTPPFGYRLEVGYAVAKREADALSAARDEARDALIAKACAGVGELRCASIKRHIHPWQDGRYDKKERSACAAMAIKADVLGSFERDLQQLGTDLDGLAAAIAGRADGTLALDPPRWPSGCVAADVGPSVAAELRNRLADHGPLRLVPLGGLEAPIVRVTLAPGREALTVSAAMQTPGVEGESPLGGFSTPMDLFDVAPDEVGACHALGVGQIGRSRGEGLQAALALPSQDGEICEGAAFEPKIEVSAPAKLAVLSVARDGAAYLVWPPPGHPGTVEGELSLGVNSAIRPPEQMGDEVMVAIAVPEGGSLGRLEGRHGFCRLPEPFAPELVPEGAAVVSETYTVVTAGEGCAPVPEATREALLGHLEAAPPCW